MQNLRILFLGDIVGSIGVDYLSKQRLLSRIIKDRAIDFTIANGENASNGNGLARDVADRILEAGADVITSGNHIWRRRETADLLDDRDNILRPANYPAAAPGSGYGIYSVNGRSLLVINLIGRTFMEPVDSPFAAADKILSREAGRYDAVFVDFHAEATSEKLALAHYLDGRASAVIGTHTHVATADASVLPHGTGYQTDAGMCGSHSGILGVKTDCIIKRFTLGIPTVHEPSLDMLEAHGVIVEIDQNGKCALIESITF